MRTQLGARPQLCRGKVAEIEKLPLGDKLNPVATARAARSPKVISCWGIGFGKNEHGIMASSANAKSPSRLPGVMWSLAA